MTTFEYATARAREALSPARVAVSRAWVKARPLTLPITGAGCFVAGAFTVSVLAGLVTAGLACFFVEWRAAR